MARRENGRPLVIVSNRLPVTGSAHGWRVSAGGLVTALRPVMESRPGVWVGWNGGSPDVPRRIDDIHADLVPVELSRADINGYYHGMSNRAIWPLFHDLVRPARFDRSWWRSYIDVNHRFASAALEAAAHRRNALLWVHDYHLMLVPELLRGTRPNSPISFFLHIPWPPPELFTRLPWRQELLRGLLGADVVSFHTDRYRKNFARTCGRLLPEATVHGNKVVLEDGRSVATSAHPISIDAREFSEIARSNEVSAILKRLRSQFRGRRVLLGVDRLDYTKGIPERLEAFEALLERRTDLRREVALIQIAVPSRTSVREYRELRGRINEAVGHINGRFTEPGGDVPIHYIHREMPRTRLVAYYLLADVMLVTPLKDGMNLVAKEFVVCQGAVGGNGVLLLSEFTGASLGLPEAISCNPFDVNGLSRRLEHALGLDSADRQARVNALAARVTTNDVHRWLRNELNDVDRGTGDTIKRQEVSVQAGGDSR